MELRPKIDILFIRYPVGIWGIFANGFFLILGLFICQINATDFNGLEYSWLNHTISELGFMGETWGWWFFSICLILGGIFNLFFFLGLGYIIEGKLSKILAKIGMITGWICAISMIGVGLTPANKVRSTHMIFASILFLFSAVTPLVFSIAIFFQKPKGSPPIIPKWSGIFGFIVVIIVSIFLNIFLRDRFTGTDPSQDEFNPQNFNSERPKFIPFFFWEWMVLYSCTIWLLGFSIITRKTNTKLKK